MRWTTKFSPLPARILRLLTFVCVAGIVAGLEQSAMQASVGPQRQALHLPNDQLLLAVRALGLGLGLGLPAGGALAIFAGLRRAQLVAVLLAAVSTVLMGIVWGLTALVIVFLVGGFGIGSWLVPAIASIALETPPHRRGFAVGLVLAAPLAGMLLWHFWADLASGLSPAGPEVLFGVLGIGWAVLFRRESEIAMPAADPDDEETPPMWPEGISLTKAMMRGGAIAGFFVVATYALSLAGEWLPAFLLEARHQDILNTPLAGFVLTAAPAIGILAGGMLTDLCLMQSGNVISARQIVIGVAFVLGSGALAVLATRQETMPILLWLAACLACSAMALAPLSAIACDIARLPNEEGTETLVPNVAIFLLIIVYAGRAVVEAASPTALAQLSHLWRLPLWLGFPMLAVATILAFRLNPAVPAGRMKRRIVEQEVVAESGDTPPRVGLMSRLLGMFRRGKPMVQAEQAET